MAKTVKTKEELLNPELLFKTEKKNIPFLKKLIKKDFWQIVVSSIFYIIKHCPLWIIPILTADAIDVATNLPSDYVKRLIIDFAIIVVLICQNYFTHRVYANISDNMLRKTSADIKMTITRKLQHLSITYFKEMENGAIQSKFLKDAESIDLYYRTFIKSILPEIFGLIISIIISLIKSPIVTLFFVLIIPINLFNVRNFRKGIKDINRKFRLGNEELSSRVNTMIHMLTLTKSHGLESTETVSIEKSVNKVTNSGLLVDKFIAKFGTINWMISTFLSALCLFFTIFLKLKGILTIGEVVLFQSLFATINAGALNLMNAFPTIAAGNEAVQSVSEIINSDELESVGGVQVPTKYKGEIEFEKVSFKYPKTNKIILNDLSMHVKSGECVAIVGSSGGGKTTLMNLLLGLIDPTSGNIKIDGVDLSSIDKNEYRHHISVVPQNSILFRGSLKDNITYGLDHYTEEDIEEAIKAANIKEFLPILPHGIDSDVGEYGDKLSGGQKQRVSIARALIRHPSILILDEATSALDNVSEHEVEKAITNVCHACTTFIIAHRLSTIKNSSRIFVLEDGKIIQNGTYEELSNVEGKFKDLVSLAK